MSVWILALMSLLAALMSLLAGTWGGAEAQTLPPTPQSYRTHLPIIWHSGQPATPITPLRGITVFDTGDEAVSNASWYYNWSPSDSNSGDVGFVPMFRPATLQSASAYRVVYANRDVLAFNEPDACPLPDSDCLTADTLAQDWHELQEALPDSRLIGPGLTNHCYGDACWSLAEFLDAYHERYAMWPRLDALAIHYYQYFGYDVNVADTTLLQPYRRTWSGWLAYMKQTLTARGYGDLPIWITEFGYQPLCGQGWDWCPTAAGVVSGLQNWLALIDQEPRIIRYAYFAAREELFTTDQSWWPMSLIRPDGTLTAAGQCYSGNCMSPPVSGQINTQQTKKPSS
jgi:hypothetical protein